MALGAAVNHQTHGAVKNALFLKTCARQGFEPLERRCMTNESALTMMNRGLILHVLYPELYLKNTVPAAS